MVDSFGLVVVVMDALIEGSVEYISINKSDERGRRGRMVNRW